MNAVDVPNANKPREAPASALVNFVDDASHASDLPDSEPLLCVDNIQGNNLAGFNKDFQTLVFLRIADPGLFKAWLADQIGFVATVSEVLGFNRVFKAIRKRREADTGTVKSTWMNIAFSAAGLRLLVADGSPDQFGDPSFKAGLFASSASLGDPVDPAAEGAAANWLFGGSADTEAHVVLIVASDDVDDLSAEIRRLEDSVYGSSDSRGGGKSVRSGATVVFKQHGATLPPPLTGHEHFGWLDGVSQPGIRGKVSSDPKDLLTLRQNPNEDGQGKPGQDCLYPGEFVFGYLKQDRTADDIAKPTGPFSDDCPPWAFDGSFYVVRRLRQDVPGFKQWLAENARNFNISADHLGSAFVGRFPHGAPIMSAANDDPVLGGDDCRNNYFEFQEAPATGAPPKDSSQCDPGTAPAPDPDGTRCPFSAHIRKAYPRDDKSATNSKLGEPDTQTHRLLRRGIPFGKPSIDNLNPPADDTGDRGLVFAAYQTSIIGQFEFVTKNWVNNAAFKQDGVGFDPILGQSGGGNRARLLRTAFTDDDGDFRDPSVTLPTDFVIPTGGGYFFSPSIDALFFIAGVANPNPACLGGHPQPPPSPPPPVPSQYNT